MTSSPQAGATAAAFVAGVGMGLIAVAAAWPQAQMSCLQGGALLGVVAATSVRLGLPAPPGGFSRMRLAVILAAIAVQYAIIWAVVPRLHGDLRQIWLAILAITAAHFLPMASVLGRWMAVMGAGCLAVAAMGVVIPAVPIAAVIAADGCVKAGIGVVTALRLRTRAVV